MPEIRSDIVVGVKGADRAAKELGKIKDKYTDIGQAAKDISPLTVGGADPFTEATRRSRSAPESEMVRAQRRSVDIQQYNDRVARHGQVGRLPQNLAGMATGTMGNLARGDVLGAAGGTMQGLGGLLGGAGMLTAAGGIFAGAMAIKGISALANAEWERIQQIYGGGIPQRLGQTYTGVRNIQLELGRRNIPLPMMQQYMTALGQAGGDITGITADNLGWLGTNAERMAQWGINPATYAQMQATRRRAGAGRQIPQAMLGMLGESFGYGRVSPAMQAVAQVMEDALARGATRASTILEDGGMNIARRIAGFSQFGGLSMEGAIALYQQTEQATRGGVQQVRGPLDVMTLRALRSENPEMDLFQLQVLAGQDTAMVQRVEYDMLRRMYGGDVSAIGRALVRSRGIAPEQAQAYIITQEAERKRRALVVAGVPPESLYAQETYGTRQMAIAAGAEEAATKLANTLAQLLNAATYTGTGIAPAYTEEELEAWREKTREWEEKTGRKLPSGILKGPSSVGWNIPESALKVEDSNALQEMNQSLKNIDNKVDGILTDERR